VSASAAVVPRPDKLISQSQQQQLTQLHKEQTVQWSVEMIFRWLEESAAFLYEIEAHRRPAHPSEPELSRRV
jgi:hypothetical protein